MGDRRELLAQMAAQIAGGMCAHGELYLPGATYANVAETAVEIAECIDAQLWPQPTECECGGDGVCGWCTAQRGGE
jgi:hypothetical protein